MTTRTNHFFPSSSFVLSSTTTAIGSHTLNQHIARRMGTQAKRESRVGWCMSYRDESILVLERCSLVRRCSSTIAHIEVSAQDRFARVGPDSITSNDSRQRAQLQHIPKSTSALPLLFQGACIEIVSSKKKLFECDRNFESSNCRHFDLSPFPLGRHQFFLAALMSSHLLPFPCLSSSVFLLLCPRRMSLLPLQLQETSTS